MPALPTSLIWLTAPGGAVVHTFPRAPGAVEQALHDIEALASSS